MLEYDNSAFYYFAMTLMALYLIPATWHVIAEVGRAFVWGDGDTTARCEAEKDKAEKLKAETTGLARLKKRAFLIHLVCVVLAWAVFAYFMYMVLSTEGQVREYDPYTILGIEHGASAGEIKKAYRRLSLKFHPDKNIGNKDAEEKFRAIAKAHEALTDEQSKENFEKYGNPDGRQQSLEVSIGLPKILLENPKVVLVLYLVGMVIVIPTAVFSWYNQSKEFGEKNIYYDTYRLWNSKMKPGEQKSKQLPEILAASAEFRKINATKSGVSPEASDASLRALEESFKEIVHKPTIEVRRGDKMVLEPSTLRGNILLHVHLHRKTDELSEEQRKDLEAMLFKAPELVDGMVDMTIQHRFIDATLCVIRFHQFIVQGLWVKSSPLEQLPGLQEAEIAALQAVAKSKGSALQDFLSSTPAERRKLLLSMERLAKPESKRLLEDVLACAELLPNVQVTLDHYVEEEGENEYDLLDDDVRAKEMQKAAARSAGQSIPSGKTIHEQDQVTLKVTMRRQHVEPPKKKGGKARAHRVLAPNFPRPLQEAWWLILVGDMEDKPVIHAIDKVTDQAEVFTHKLRFMCPYPASSKMYDMKVVVVSDCYCGLDQEHPFSYRVHPQSDLPAYASHEEDLALDNEPTLFEQVMTQTMDYDSSDDEDDDKAKASSGGAQQKRQAAADDDDDEEEEEDD